MLESMTDITQPDGFIRYSRGVALSRLILVAGLFILLTAFGSWPMIALGVAVFGLYLALFVAAELARRHPDPVAAARRLRWQSDSLMVMLVIAACWLAVLIRLYDDPIAKLEAALLATAALMQASLRAHTSRLTHVIAVAPPALTLIWIAVDWPRPVGGNHYALAMMLFVAAVLVVTWRQQSTDRLLTQALRDLTRKNAALSEAVAEAKSASRAKTDLLALASHEIRTPLNAVLGFAQALRAETLSPDQAELARGVLEGGEQLTRLLEGMLNLVRDDVGQARLDPRPVDLRRMIHSVMRVWTVHARAIGVHFDFEDADPTLSFSILGDEARIEQTLVNLVANAMGAAAVEGRVTIRLAGVPKGESLGVLVEVSDTGPVVPAADRARMFEAFDQTARGGLQGGSGLGLKICAQNLALMGGEVGVDNLIGRDERPDGAVFWFAFDAPVHVAGDAASIAAPGGTRQVRVLAAEDNPANRNVLAALLVAAPVSLVFAEDGAQALDAWRAQPFDLILMDVNMPALNGLDAVREIRRAEAPGARIPIWMLTANVFEDDISRYLEGGADGVLRKPIDVAVLFTLLAEVAETLASRDR
jgi:signal transduction histidine kinase/ActR/RegA family two-component response regulator